MGEVEDTPEARLDFAKRAASRLGHPNVDNLKIEAEQLQDELGNGYHPITGVVLNGRTQWFRFYPPDDKYPGLYAVESRNLTGNKRMAWSIYCVGPIGFPKFWWGACTVPPPHAPNYRESLDCRLQYVSGQRLDNCLQTLPDDAYL